MLGRLGPLPTQPITFEFPYAPLDMGRVRIGDRPTRRYCVDCFVGRHAPGYQDAGGHGNAAMPPRSAVDEHSTTGIQH